MKKTRLTLITIAIAGFLWLPFDSSAFDQTLPVKPGWDLTPKLQKGSVVYSVSGPRGRSKLDLSYILVGAEPNQRFHVTIAVFDANKPDGVKFFGVARFDHANYTREQKNATIDSFIVGAFRTDANGNGQAHFKLDLSKVPAGAYNVQFGWTKLLQDGGQNQCFYRTGEKFAQGFASIKVS